MRSAHARGLAWIAPLALAAVLAPVSSGAPIFIAVAPATVTPGHVVHITGAAGGGCSHGDSVTLISQLFPGHAFGGEGAIDAKPNAVGRFDRAYRVPAGTTRGSYTIGGRCGGGNLGVTATLHVR